MFNFIKNWIKNWIEQKEKDRVKYLGK